MAAGRSSVRAIPRGAEVCAGSYPDHGPAHGTICHCDRAPCPRSVSPPGACLACCHGDRARSLTPRHRGKVPLQEVDGLHGLGWVAWCSRLASAVACCRAADCRGLQFRGLSRRFRNLAASGAPMLRGGLVPCPLLYAGSRVERVAPRRAGRVAVPSFRGVSVPVVPCGGPCGRCPGGAGAVPGGVPLSGALAGSGPRPLQLAGGGCFVVWGAGPAGARTVFAGGGVCRGAVCPPAHLDRYRVSPVALRVGRGGGSVAAPPAPGRGR